MSLIPVEENDCGTLDADWNYENKSAVVTQADQAHSVKDSLLFLSR